MKQLRFPTNFYVRRSSITPKTDCLLYCSSRSTIEDQSLDTVPIVPFYFRMLGLSAFTLAILTLVACSPGVFMDARAGVAIKGTLRTGQLPVSNAAIQLYAAGNAGDGSPSTALLASPTYTNSSGEFNVDGYSCPSEDAMLYITATGGTPTSSSGKPNPQFAEMTALGSCGMMTSTSEIKVNELTTIAAVSALAPFMKSYLSVGAGADDRPSLASAFEAAAELANSADGATSGLEVSADKLFLGAKLATLANILSTCTDSASGSAGGTSPCGLLFSRTLSNKGEAPTDTITAMLNVANDPTSNVDAIFALRPSRGPFQPTLSIAPKEWALNIESIPAGPTFSPGSGSSSEPIPVTLSNSRPATAIYPYLTDPSVNRNLGPEIATGSASGLYTAPAAISTAQIVDASATSPSHPGITGVATVSLQSSVTIGISPASIMLQPSQSQTFTASVGNSANIEVKWTLQPSVGSLTGTGIYTAPASISSDQNVTVSVTSVADPTKSASALIALKPNYFSHPGSADSPFNTPLTANEQLGPLPAGFSSLLTDLSSWFRPQQASSPAVWQAAATDPQVSVLFNLSSYDNVNSGLWKRENNSPTVEAQILASSSTTWQVPSSTYGASAKFYYMTTTNPANGWTPPMAPQLNPMTEIPTGGLRIYAPKNALPAQDSDGYFAIFQPDGSVLECYSGIVLSNGTIVCGTFNITQSTSTLTGSQGGVMASTVPVYAGLVREADLDAGAINHALNICISATQLTTSFTGPAISFDRTPNYSGNLPMGTRLAIPLTVNLAAHHFNSATGLMIAKAAQSYGMFLLDRGGLGSLTIRTEQNVTSAAVTNAWDWNTEQDLNWIISQLQVVK